MNVFMIELFPTSSISLRKMGCFWGGCVEKGQNEWYIHVSSILKARELQWEVLDCRLDAIREGPRFSTVRESYRQCIGAIWLKSNGLDLKLSKEFRTL